MTRVKTSEDRIKHLEAITKGSRAAIEKEMRSIAEIDVELLKKDLKYELLKELRPEIHLFDL